MDHEDKWPQSRREEYHAQHPERFAGPHMSFPIKDAEDVEHAASLHGQSDDPDATKAKIKSIAKSMNLSDALPKEWQEEAEDDNDQADDAQDPSPGDEYDSYGNIKEQQPHSTWRAARSFAAAQDDRMTEAVMQIQGQILEGQSLTKSGHEVRVTVIKGGKSRNGFAYDPQTLQQMARMLEGAQAYADHDTSVAVRSVRDLVGFYKNATYMPPDSSNPDGRVDATLHILEQAEWLWSIIHEAVSIGKPELIGLSVDIFGKWTQANDAKHVTSISQINSCDIVTRPSAGGEFQRIIHDSTPTTQTHKGALMPDPITTPTPTTTPPAAPPATPPTEGRVAETHVEDRTQSQLMQQRILEEQRIKEQQRQIDDLLQQARLERCAVLLERRLIESILPGPVKNQIKERFSERIYEEAELELEMTRSLSMMAQLSKDGTIKDHGFEKAAATDGQVTEAEKIQAAFDMMFEDGQGGKLEIDPKFKSMGVRAFNGLRDAYIRATGDGQISGASTMDLGPIRVSEAAPIGRITEADTTTASFSFLLGTSMNKRLLKDYQAWPAEWAKFCTVVPIKDFKQQTRVRLGAFGSLSTVPEDTAYTSISLQDSAATYVPTKRGNLVTVSRETIINDDLFAIKQIPTKLAVAAAYTLAEFVYAFLSSNANIYDGSALFTTGAPHTNLGTANLSSASMQLGVTAMREQTNFANKRIGLRPKYLIVPPELEFTAIVVTKSAGVPGSTNNDVNPMLGYVQPIVSPQLSNTTQWFFVADPMVIDTIEVGFVGGQVNPALFIQDQPLFGLNFNQDVISYKIRHEYGGAVVDYRGLYRGV